MDAQRDALHRTPHLLGLRIPRGDLFEPVEKPPHAEGVEGDAAAISFLEERGDLAEVGLARRPQPELRDLKGAVRKVLEPVVQVPHPRVPRVLPGVLSGRDECVRAGGRGERVVQFVEEHLLRSLGDLADRLEGAGGQEPEQHRELVVADRHARRELPGLHHGLHSDLDYRLPMIPEADPGHGE